MISITEVAKVVSGRVIHSSGETLTNGALFFDSRNTVENGIFLALKGEKSDGHDFVAQSGCAFALVEREVNFPAIVVDDVMKAAGVWAAFHRNSLGKLTVIGITGSQGKTTTKDMLAHMLSSFAGRESVVAPAGSYNNDLGLPVVLTSCTSETRFCVAEMGARHKGDISRLAATAAPDIGIVLKVGNAHLGEFGSREQIAAAKSELVTGIKSNGIAILGTYDEFTPAMSQLRSDLNLITFGERGDEMIRATDVEARGGFAHFELVTPRGREMVELRIAGMHNVANALASAAVGYALAMPENEIATALSTFEPLSQWRMELHSINGVIVVNDSYNANPESMVAALETTRLLAQEQGGRTFAFLGTMNELGDASDRMHQEIATTAEKLGIDYLISVGEKRYLLEKGSLTETILAENLERAREKFAAIEPGDCVLFKASRSVGLERLAKDFITLLGSRESLDEEISKGSA
jgi:UDP-N-acetylmuramoyl-tripeptide--D-alanyl-D-alanine ligase